MKKFLEFCVTSRKESNGELILTAEVFAENQSKIGQLQVKKLNDETNAGIFFRYVPEEGSLTDEISAIHFIGNKDKISKVLSNIKSYSVGNLKTLNPSLSDLLLMMAICNCIDPEKCNITFPKDVITMINIHLTNEFIGQYISDEWIGLELKSSSEIQEKVKKANEAVDKKRKEAEQKAKESLDELLDLIALL